MKALTLHQPWASLVALGVKTIETRSWSTKYRGPLAIHAGIRTPDFAAVGDYTVGRLDPGQPRRMWKHTTNSPIHDLPLGAVVATCTLVDVVPMVWRTWPQEVTENCLSIHPPDADEDRLVLWTLGQKEGRNVTDQRPYGDFTPGRFAWLLDDVKPTTERCPACWGTGDHEQGYDPIAEAYIDVDLRLPCGRCGGEGGCDPVPARGRQGLWEWTP